MLCHVTRMLVTLLLNAVTWNGGALGTKNICESGRKKTNKQTNQQLLSKVYRELTREVNKLEMLTLYRINMRYWLRVKSRWFNIAWDEDEVNKKAKKAGRISSHLERTSLVNEGYYYTNKKKTSSCGTDSENLRRARWASSQSEHRIHLILTARGFAQTIR